MKANKIISNQLISELLPQAASNSRNRINHNIHRQYSDKVQRFLNVIEYDSYVRPHYHTQDNAWEGFVIIRGQLSVLQFDLSGKLVNRSELSEDGPIYGIELDANFPHSVTALSAQAIVFEYKEGPYLPDNDKIFPSWAPTDNIKQAQNYHRWLKTAKLNEQYQQQHYNDSDPHE